MSEESALAGLLASIDSFRDQLKNSDTTAVIEPLSADQIAQLASCLEISADDEQAKLLNEAVARSARNLIGFFTAGTDGQHEDERNAELKRIAADPARTLLSQPGSEGAQSARDVLIVTARANGLDETTTLGAAAIGDLAKGLLDQKKRRVDANLVLGEDQLFEDCVAILGSLKPESLVAFPANEWGADRHPAVQFAAEFVVQVADRALAVVPASDKRSFDRLVKLKNKSPRSILDALREPRRYWHENDQSQGYSD